MMSLKYLSKIVLLSLAHPLFLLTLPAINSPGAAENLLLAFLTALIQAFALAEVVSHHRGLSRAGLIWRLGLLFYGATFFQAGVEAVLFLNYMQTTMSQTELAAMFIFGLAVTVVAVPLAVFLFYRKREETPPLSLPSKMLLMRVGGLSVLYMVVYMAFGEFVFMPLAGEHFDAFYGNMQEPVWLFPFQIIRGAVWALLVYGLIRTLIVQRRSLIYRTTLFIALPFSSLLLPHNEAMPAYIRFPHLVEILSSMLLFGFLCAWYLTKPLTDKMVPDQSGQRQNSTAKIEPLP